ncbi:MAG TPA: IclR family transcriptional regulator [Desulfuromonadales bacterium]|nr:IclR family transcriptional regulator [Desulfuromonadales bacterium]
MPERTQDYFAKTLEKGLRILNLFDERRPSWGLTEIAEQVDLNLTSVYRLVNTFVALGYLKKNPRSKQLRLGPMAVALGGQLLHGFDIRQMIEPLVEGVHQQHQISIDVSLFHNDRLIRICKTESPNTLTYRQDTVSQLLYCTASGKSVLAFLPVAECETLLSQQSFARLGPRTLVDPDALQQELAQVRRRGYARNNEEYVKGLIAIAAPLLGRTSGYPLGAVSFTSTTLDHTLTDFENRYAGILRELADQIAAVIHEL